MVKIKLDNKFQNNKGDLIREITVYRHGEPNIKVVMENSYIIYTSKKLTGTEASIIMNRY